MSVGSPNSLKSPTEQKQFTDSTQINGQRNGKVNGDIDEPVPAQRKSMMKKLVGGVAVLPTFNRSMPKDEDNQKENHKENQKTSPVVYDYEPSRRTIPEQVRWVERL